jgi:hypothetical protein
MTLLDAQRLSRRRIRELKALGWPATLYVTTYYFQHKDPVQPRWGNKSARGPDPLLLTRFPDSTSIGEVEFVAEMSGVGEILRR